MPFCPSCRAEFREGFDRCASCDAFLVAELEPDWADPRVAAAALENETLSVAFLGDLAALRRMRDELGERGVPAMVGPPPAEIPCDTGCSTRLALFVRQRDVDAVRAHIVERADEDLDDLVLPPGGQDDAAGDAGDGTDVCPACSTAIRAANAQECPECGLFIGD